MSKSLTKLYRQRNLRQRRAQVGLRNVLCLSSQVKPDYRRTKRVYARQMYAVSALVQARLSELVSDCRTFIVCMGMSYCVFIVRVYRPMLKVYPAGPYRYQLPLLHRVYRMLRFMRGETLNSLADIFGQDRSTVQTDIQMLVRLFATRVAPLYIQYPSIDSEEYRLMRGAGDFHQIPHCVYAGDVMSVEIGLPSLTNPSVDYDFKHHQHSKQVTFLVDGVAGLCRVMIGPTSGNAADKGILDRSNFFRNVTKFVFVSNQKLGVCLKVGDCSRYLAPMDCILYDGAFHETLFGYFYSPTTGYMSELRRIPQPAGTLANNARIRKARSIVEHFFSRLKGQWRIFNPFRLRRHNLKAYLYVAVALTNIMLLFVTPLRDTRCVSRECYYCNHNL